MTPPLPTRRVRWIPHEHGAWAILAVPLLLGIAAAGPHPAHLLLAVAAVSAYLFSVPAVEWVRTRRPEHVLPATVFGLVLSGSGGALLIAHPGLVPLVAVVGGASVAAVALVLAGRATSVAVSLVQVVQAVALVPAAATIAGTLAEPSTARATLMAGSYLIGSVLLVRSMIRARGNGWFLATSIGFHAVAALVAAILLPWPYAALAVGLLARAVALPALQARVGAGPRRLRPIHIGLVEIVASTALVALAFVNGF